MEIVQIVKYSAIDIVAFIGRNGEVYYPQNWAQFASAVDFTFEAGGIVVDYADGRRVLFDEKNHLFVGTELRSTLSGLVCEMIILPSDCFPVEMYFVHGGNLVTIPPHFNPSCVYLIGDNYYLSDGFIKLKKKPTQSATNLTPYAVVSVFYNSCLKYYLTFDALGRPLFIAADFMKYREKHNMTIQCGYIFVNDCFCSYNMPFRTGHGICEMLIINGRSARPYVQYVDGTLYYGDREYKCNPSFAYFNVYKTGPYMFAINMVNGNFMILFHS